MAVFRHIHDMTSKSQLTPQDIGYNLGGRMNVKILVSFSSLTHKTILIRAHFIQKITKTHHEKKPAHK